MKIIPFLYIRLFCLFDYNLSYNFESTNLIHIFFCFFIKFILSISSFILIILYHSWRITFKCSLRDIFIFIIHLLSYTYLCNDYGIVLYCYKWYYIIHFFFLLFLFQNNHLNEYNYPSFQWRICIHSNICKKIIVKIKIGSTI